MPGHGELAHSGVSYSLWMETAVFENDTASATRSVAAEQSANGRNWLRIGIADLLLIVLALGIIGRSQGSMLDDPGLGWHLRHVDAIWSQGGWLTTDPFSGPRGGEPWITNQW